MRCRIWSKIATACALLLGVTGAQHSAQAQTPYYSSPTSVLPSSAVVPVGYSSRAAEPRQAPLAGQPTLAGGQQPNALPSVQPPATFGVQPTSAVTRLPAQPVSNARVLELEARLAEVEAQLQKQAAAADKDKDKKDDKKKGYIIGSDNGLTGKWTNDGAAFGSKNGDFKWRMRGLVQLDSIAIRQPGSSIVSSPGGALASTDSVSFRRLRFGAEGTMYETIDWVSEFDFALALQNVDQRDPAAPSLGLRSFPTGTGVQGGNTINVIQPTVVNMTFKEVPFFSNIRIGNQQDWFSFDHIESARFLDFMERAPIMDAFSGANNNGYTPGISAFRSTENKRANLYVGVYKNNVYDSGNTYDLGNNNVTYNARATWTPWYDEPTNGRYMIHTGLGSEYRTFNKEPFANTDGTNVRLRSRGDLRNVSSTIDANYADTGNFFAQNQTLLCPELVFQYGPWLFQSEYVASFMGGAAANRGGAGLGNVFFQGGYAEMLYFLTGENRDYNRQSGVFNRVVPFQNASFTRGAGMCGLGAWQVGMRYDWLDLNSGAINGGNASDLTFGINWFLNSNARFQMNYVHTWVNNAAAATFPGTVGSLNGSRFVGDGNIDAFGARMDFNF